MELESRDVLFQLYNYITLANQGLEIFAPSIDNQLRLFESSDQLDKSEEKSLSYSISHKLKDLDGTYISESLKDGKLEKFLKTLNSRFTFDGKFVNTKLRKSGTFQDGDQELLTPENILKMSDLDILSQINAYQNPYSGHKHGRTLYEHLFGELISYCFQPVTKFSESESPEFIKFQIIHETMYILHLVSQNAISIIEVFMLIIKIVNSRIRTSSLSIRIDLRLPEFDNPIIKNSLENLQSEDKIYNVFRNKNIANTISRLSDIDSTWLIKIQKSHEVLESILEQAEIQNTNLFDRVVGLKSMLVACKESYIDLEIYLSDLLLFISEFHTFVILFGKNLDGYPKFFNNVSLLLEKLEELEKEYPTVYGEYITPEMKTPRNQPSARQNIHTRRAKTPDQSPLSSPHAKIIETKKPYVSKLDLSSVKMGYQ